MDSESENPKVFVCHSGDDEERFVHPMATGLRDAGIDAWVDDWEILPGDSVVDEIFEEGIPNSDAMIVVLSENSIDNKWVREELNHGVIRRIEEEIKLIPVVLDELSSQDVPGAIRTIHWEAVEDTSNFDSTLERIVNSIYGVKDKPELGNPPEHVERATLQIGQLSPYDSGVLRRIGDHAVNQDRKFFQPVNLVESEGEVTGELLESIEVLAESGYLNHEASGGLREAHRRYSLNLYGFQAYAESCLQEYPAIFEQVCGELVNDRPGTLSELDRRVDAPKFVLEQVLRILESRGLISGSAVGGGDFLVSKVSTSLKRELRE